MSWGILGTFLRAIAKANSNSTIDLHPLGLPPIKMRLLTMQPWIEIKSLSSINQLKYINLNDGGKKQMFVRREKKIKD